jgi:phage terminase large subunit
VKRVYRAYGGAAEYIKCTDLEALCDSGAGTGKTFSLMHKAHMVANNHPGSRQVFARVTRKSMNDSVLPEWEEKVLWRGHPAIHGTAGPAHRDDYRYPNGSVIVLHGLDNIDRILSSAYDRIYIFQAEEMTGAAGIEVWDKLITRLRNGKTPYHQITGDVNPGPANHWINVRANRKICSPCQRGERSDGFPLIVEMNEDIGAPVCPECLGVDWQYQMRRIRYRHEDNPRLYDHENRCWRDFGKEYIGNELGRLKGVSRERLLRHRWVAEEGVILDEWDDKVHMLDGKMFKPGTDPTEKNSVNWRLHVEGWPVPIPVSFRYGATTREAGASLWPRSSASAGRSRRGPSSRTSSK